MGRTSEELTENLAEWLCWEVARRDDGLMARRLCRKHVVDGIYRLDEGDLLDDFSRFPRDSGKDPHRRLDEPPDEVRTAADLICHLRGTRDCH
jgi:hypothetical protein